MQLDLLEHHRLPKRVRIRVEGILQAAIGVTQQSVGELLDGVNRPPKVRNSFLELPDKPPGQDPVVVDFAQDQGPPFSARDASAADRDAASEGNDGERLGKARHSAHPDRTGVGHL